MTAKELYVNVLLPLPLPEFFTYAVPALLENEVAVGKRVLVPFGKHKFYSAIIYSIHHDKPANYQTKDILSVLDEVPLVNDKQLALWIWIADYYMCTYGEVMAVALPSAFKLASETRIALHPDYDGEISHLSHKEVRIVESLVDNKTLTIKQIEQITQQARVLPFIKNLIEKGIVFFSEEIDAKYKTRTVTFICLNQLYQEDESRLNEVFETLEKTKRTQKQSDALLYFLSLLQQQKDVFIRKSELLSSERINESQLQALLKKGILEKHDKTLSRLKVYEPEKEISEIVLSPEQETAMQSIKNQFHKNNTVLFHGVTGSGKTEIYMKLIQEVLEEGKQVLYLLPEIALTTQIIHRLRTYFGNKVGVYHSRFSEFERVEIWQHVSDKTSDSYRVIIGARSALFLPFNNLGLIIVDEEHDMSYKQFEPSPHYQARDSAIVLAKLHEAKTLLGSATPAIETYNNTAREKYGLVSLYQRYGGVELPNIKIVDLRKENRKKQNYTLYSKPLLESITQALAKKEQIILFQNRRGFSVHLECGLCNYIPTCKHCDVTLTYHKKNNELRCHYCGYKEAVPQKCDLCQNPHMEMRGIGTEKVEEELQLFFPQAKIARLDYDSTRSKSAYQQIISNFENRKIDILVGTQMVTKGLDFDNVSTVGILNADNMLYYPDFRSFERAFQMLSQVSGRAGRKNKQGQVLIQTFNPHHPIFQLVICNDYQTLFHKSMIERKQFTYPPFCRLIKITLKHKKQETLDKLAKMLAVEFKKVFLGSVLGPEYPPIMKIKNLYQKDIILKINLSKSLVSSKNIIKKIISLPVFKSIQIHLDVDPY
ncbi:MAG: Primosomal protein N' [Bacteroidetes bacterium ADurb.Bin234]|nr:MAG: Primosomal protein N' [Bacteroidetes bacterium ADurb.Bin234]